MFTVNLAHLIGRGVRLDAREAVAVAQTIVDARAVAAPENVEVRSDGGIVAIQKADALAVADAAALLERLLPPDVKAPAPLRFSIARGLGRVEAPPFESLEAFSAALRRFESAPRADVVRGLLARAAPRPRAEAPRSPIAPVARARPTSRRRAPRRSARGATYVVFALAASAIAGFLFMRAAMLRQTHSMTQSAAAAAAAVSVAAPESPGPAVAERPVASSGRTDTLQPIVRARAFSPAFTPDGRAVFFQTGDPRDPSSAIAIASLDPGPDGGPSITRIVDEGSRNYHARPSPDGRFIAFDSDRDGERGVYVAERDGSDARRVSGPGYAALPSWSPDGSRLAYIRAERDRPSVWNLWIQPVDGPARRVTRNAYGQTWSASWFPDNRRICYTHEDTLMVLDLDNGRWRRFRSPIAGALLRTPAVAPDGSRIVFQVFRDGAWMLDMASGTMTRVLSDPTAEEFAWAPDGSRIAFHSRRNGQWGIYLLSRG
jgi:hypothetical protein